MIALIWSNRIQSLFWQMNINNQPDISHQPREQWNIVVNAKLCVFNVFISKYPWLLTAFLAILSSSAVTSKTPMKAYPNTTTTAVSGNGAGALVNWPLDPFWTGTQQALIFLIQMHLLTLLLLMMLPIVLQLLIPPFLSNHLQIWWWHQSQNSEKR